MLTVRRDASQPFTWPSSLLLGMRRVASDRGGGGSESRQVVRDRLVVSASRQQEVVIVRLGESAERRLVHHEVAAPGHHRALERLDSVEHCHDLSGTVRVARLHTARSKPCSHVLGDARNLRIPLDGA